MANQNHKPTVSVGDNEVDNKAVAEQVVSTPHAEEDFLQGLIEAENYVEDEQVEVEVARPIKDSNGNPIGESKVFFKFRIKPLSEAEYNACRKAHTKYNKNKQLGIVVAEDTDNVRYRCQLIYNATVQEDRESLWDNKRAWEAYRAKGHMIKNGLDIIEFALKAGEKDQIVDLIDEISGYKDDNLEEVIKN